MSLDFNTDLRLRIALPLETHHPSRAFERLYTKPPLMIPLLLIILLIFCAFVVLLIVGKILFTLITLMIPVLLFVIMVLVIIRLMQGRRIL